MFITKKKIEHLNAQIKRLEEELLSLQDRVSELEQAQTELKKQPEADIKALLDEWQNGEKK